MKYYFVLFVATLAIIAESTQSQPIEQSRGREPHAATSSNAASSPQSQRTQTSQQENRRVDSSPSTTALSALIAAFAAIVVAGINTWTQRGIQRSNANTQQALQLLTNELRERETEDQRAFSLRMQHAEPFFNALIKSVNLATDAHLTAGTLKSCPLSADFRRELLNGTGVVEKWGQNGVELCERMGGMLLVLNVDAVNAFVSSFNAMIVRQITQVQILQRSFNFDETSYTDLEKECKLHSKDAAALFVILREAITKRAGTGKQSSGFDVEGLAGSLRFKASALTFDFAHSVPTWTCWWTLLHMDDSSVLDQIDMTFRQLVAALETLDGVIAIRQEQEQTSKAKHIALTLEFASLSHRDKFIAVLPAIKQQSACLWRIDAKEIVGAKNAKVPNEA